MSGATELVDAVKALCGEEARVLVLNGSNPQDAARSQQDLDASELDAPLALRVLDLRGIPDRNAALNLATGFSGYAIAASIEMMATPGFAPCAEFEGLFTLSDPLEAGRRWFSENKPRSVEFALMALDAQGLNLCDALEAARLATSIGKVQDAGGYWARAASHDRSLGEAYIGLASAAREKESLENEYVWLLEASRAGKASERLVELETALAGDDALKVRRKMLGFEASSRLLPAASKVLVLTNLFPPQEMGGYGRKMWEFAYDLRRRGHELLVLAGDAPYLYKKPEGEEAALEDCVQRSLKLFGRWAGGVAELSGDGPEIVRAMEFNRAKVRKAIREFKPEYCLMGNLDLLGHFPIEELTQSKIPTVQCMGNCVTGWIGDFVPDERWFRPGPASDFLREGLKEAGFELRRPRTLYPGARIDRFYREAMPSIDVPRIAFAGLLLPYKGAHTLVEALGLLKQGGLEFEATIAGDSTDQTYVQALKDRAKEEGMGECVCFSGFLNRRELNGLFCRSNILVFPSVFDEPFGISQVEAMASGMAVITTGRGGSKEIIRDGIDGLIFEGNNAVDLAKKIAQLVAEPDRWIRIAEAGRARALEFSIPATVDKIETLFAEMKRENAVATSDQ